MTNLMSQILELQTAVRHGKDNAEHKKAIDSYVSILEDGRPILDRVSTSKQYREALSLELGASLNPEDEVSEMGRHQASTESLVVLSDSWKEKDYLIKQDESFAKFITSMNSFIETSMELSDSMRDKWFRQVQSELELPEVITAKLRGIPGQKSYVQEYERDLNALLSQADDILDIDGAKQLKELVKNIKNIKGEMDLDLPDSISDFILATETGASLDLLNEAVLNWLKDNDQYDNYVIRRKGR